MIETRRRSWAFRATTIVDRLVRPVVHHRSIPPRGTWNGRPRAAGSATSLHPMGRVVHFEIHAADPERAVAFYTTVFGWSVMQVPGQDYWLLTTGEDGQPGINGAVLRRMGDAPPVGAPIVGAVNTVQVTDLDATLAKAFELDAVLALDKMVIPGVGTVAYVLDPDHNVVGMLQPEG